ISSISSGHALGSHLHQRCGFKKVLKKPEIRKGGAEEGPAADLSEAAAKKSTLPPPPPLGPPVRPPRNPRLLFRPLMFTVGVGLSQSSSDWPLTHH
uniref:Uncharacterized protein n=1 Tax=Astyanax mexicanus TaxID=7994 RepID=A0A8B9HHQ8_ASTMX